MKRSMLALALCAAVAACEDDEVTLPGTPPTDPTSPGQEGNTSPNPHVRFKGPSRLNMELARILGFDQDEVCQELGQYDCFPVHAVALGGVDPFGVSLYTPTDPTGTTSLAIERVVLAGCIERAVRDLSSPSSAVIFKDLKIDNGSLDVSHASAAEAIDTLYTRAMQRHAKESEIAHLRHLYDSVEADSTAPAQDWASLSCFAVLTSLESLFY